MKSQCLLFYLLFLVPFFSAKAATVNNISASYHDGQIFIIWDNITNADTGFYYVYCNTVPIDSTNIQSSTYLGRVMYNFGFDYRLSYSDPNGIFRYLIVNDNPLTYLTPTQNMFVMNCTVNKQSLYFAVRCDYGRLSPNYKVKPGQNATTKATVGHLDPIRAYHYETLKLSDSGSDQMEVYSHYGSNVAVGSYPAMANEGCLVFHFGIIETGPVGGMNSCYMKFHGGNGNFITNALDLDVDNCWKISFDDWIPAFSSEIDGDNTRWLGYSDQVNIYTVSKKSKPPTTGTIRAYTYYRVRWELDWIMQLFPNTIDLNRCYLVGESQGCSAVLLNGFLNPTIVAAGSCTDGKYDLDAPDDDNPDCKYNEGKSGRSSVDAYWGDHLLTNLPTDITKKPGGGAYWNVYDLTNMNDVFNYYKDIALPWLQGINGKEDATVCWEEKVGYYQTVDKTHEGGQYFYDLRNHGGGPENEWPSLNLKLMTRFTNNISFPAFSNSSIDGDPGSDSNPNPPYWSGDSIGTVHGNLDWLDSSIHETNTSWQTELYIHPDTLTDGTYIPRAMPASAKADVTIRRPSKFINIPENTTLCWTSTHNGKIIQDGNITQKYSGTTPKAITIKKVKIFPDGTILRVAYCSLPKPPKVGGFQASANSSDAVYPNPFKNSFVLSFSLEEKSKVSVELYNLLGNKIQEVVIQDMEPGYHSAEVNTAALLPGVYFVKMKSLDGERSFKVVKE